MRDRAISIGDLNQLRLWIDSQPEVPEGDWFKDFGSFKICGHGSLPKTFLRRGQVAKGRLFDRYSWIAGHVFISRSIQMRDHPTAQGTPDDWLSAWTQLEGFPTREACTPRG
jgi:hypothetical protein